MYMYNVRLKKRYRRVEGMDCDKIFQVSKHKSEKCRTASLLEKCLLLFIKEKQSAHSVTNET